MIYRARAFDGVSTLEVNSDLPSNDPLAIRRGGEPLEHTLRPKTHALLLYLLANPNQVIDFDRLRTYVWQNEGATFQVIDRTLSELKRGLGKHWIECSVKAGTCALWAKVDSSSDSGARAANCSIFTKDQIDQAIGSVNERLHNRVAELWISGLDNSYVAIAQTGPLIRVLRQGARIKLMGVDPDGPAAAMLDVIFPRFEANSLKKQVDKVIDTARELRKFFPETFEYKLLPIVPALGFFIIDPRLSSQQVKVEIFTAPPWNPLRSRPHLVIPEQSPKWREYFIAQFENYWNLSRSPFE